MKNSAVSLYNVVYVKWLFYGNVSKWNVHIVHVDGATIIFCPFFLLASQPGSLHVVIDNYLVTGQNDQSTLTAVQNLILLNNAR